MAIRSHILLDQIRWQIIVWNISLAVLAAIYFYYGYFEQLKAISWFVWLVGSGAGIITAKVKFQTSRHLLVLKSTSSNIKNLLIFVCFQNLLLIANAFLILFFLMYIFNSSAFVEMSPWNYQALVFYGFLFMCASDLSLAGSGIHPMKVKTSIWLIPVSCVLGLGIAYAFIKIFEEYSPLLSTYLSYLVLLAFFFFATSDVVKLMPKRTRIKCYAISAMAFTVLQLLFGYVDYKYSTNPTYVFAPEQTWDFADIDKVKTIEDWVMWQNKLKTLDSLTAEQIIASYEKLQMLCPPKPRDDVTKVECVGEHRNRDYQFTGSKVRSEEEVLQLLSAPTEYAQMMGMFYARKIPKPLTADMIKAIEYIAEKDNNIQILAKNTLTQSYPADYRAGFSVFVKRFEPSVE